MPVDIQRDIFDPEKEYRSGIKQKTRIAYAWDDTLDNDQATFNALAGPARLLRVAGEATSLLIPRSLLGDNPEPALMPSGSGLTADFDVVVGSTGDGTRGAAFVHRDRVVIVDRPVTSYLDTDNWMFKGKVTSAVGGPSNLVINDTERAFSEAHGLVNCRVTFTSGLLNGQTIEVSHYLSATSLRLDSPHGDAPSAGDTYVIYPPALVLPDTYALKLMSWWENTGIDVDADLEDDGLVTPVTDAVPSYRRRLHWCIYADNGSTSFPDNDVNGWFDSLYVDTIATLTVSSGTTVEAEDIVLAEGVYVPAGALLDNVLDAAYRERVSPGSWKYSLPTGVDAYPVTYVTSGGSGSDVSVSGGRADAGSETASGRLSMPVEADSVNTDGGGISSSRGVIYHDATSGLLRADNPTLTEGETPLVAYAANAGTRVIGDVYSLAGPVARFGCEYTMFGGSGGLSITPGHILHSGAHWPVNASVTDPAALVPSPGPSQEYFVYIYNAGGGRLLNGVMLDITPPRGDGTFPNSVYSLTADSDATFAFCIGMVFHREVASVSYWTGAYRAGRVYFGGVGGAANIYSVGTLTADSTWTSLDDIPLCVRALRFRFQPTISEAAASCTFSIRQYYSSGATTMHQADYTCWAGTGFQESPIDIEVPNMSLTSTSLLVQARVISADATPSVLVFLEEVAWSDFSSQYNYWYALS